MPRKSISKIFNCTRCKKPFTRNGNKKSKDRNGKTCENIFCSMDCYRLFVAEERNRKANTCKGCGSLVNQVAKGKNVYCSKACKDELASRLAHLKCQVCGVLFCAIKFGRNKDGEVRRLVKDKTRKCCSKECVSRFMREDEDRKSKVSRSGPDHHNWQGGIQGYRNSYRGPGWVKIAEKCRELHNRRCKNCGKTEKENGRKLDVNHITPWHQMTDKVKANHQSNLEALCRVCHTSIDRKWKRENPVQLLMVLWKAINRYVF